MESPARRSMVSPAHGHAIHSAKVTARGRGRHCLPGSIVYQSIMMMAIMMMAIMMMAIMMMAIMMMAIMMMASPPTKQMIMRGLTANYSDLGHFSHQVGRASILPSLHFNPLMPGMESPY